MNKKLEVLQKIANILNNNKIKWNLGTSCMLYLRGITKGFDDIDIMISEHDILKVMSLFQKFQRFDRESSDQYKTKFFVEYKIDDVDIDFMSGFAIVNKGLEYHFPYVEKQYDIAFINDEKIYLESVEVWLHYYKLMNRKDKVDIINDYLDVI